jgi:hypothetical protein
MTRTNRTRPRTLPLGTYSDGSCKAEDRIDALLPELERLHLLKADRAAVNRLGREYDALPKGERWNGHDEPVIDWTDDQHEQADGILDALIQIAENYLPEFCLLGNAGGDGACFGVWADVESAQRAVSEGEVWAEVDGKDRDGFAETHFAKFHGDQPVAETERLNVPRGDLYLTISDHGNVSLYRSIGKGNSREIWGVV